MTHVAKHSRPAGTPFSLERPSTVRNHPAKVVSRSDAGIAVLAVAAPERPTGPVTNATWASTIRKTARALVWALPISAAVSGAATLGSLRAGGPTQYLTSDEPVRLVLWVAGVWLGLVAMLALTGLLAAARSRVSAFIGLVLGMLGSLVMMMFVVVPAGTPIFGVDARWIALGGGAVYSLGWLFLGWSLLRSRLFSRGDGLLLMLAGPLLGAGGVWLAPLHTLGALLTLAAGIGIAWTSGRLVPAVGRAAAARKEPPAASSASAAPARVAVSG
jgi:hypothetical protein